MATSLSVSASGNSKDGNNDCIDITSEPHQPKNVTFPKVLFGKTKPVLRSFQVHWFQKWKWLHWHTANERAYCHTCLTAFKKGRLSAGCADAAFILRGFQNWKDATISFAAHGKSLCHKEAVEKVITLPATTRDIAESLSSALAKQKKVNRECLLKILRCTQFLARQGLPLRGDGTGEDDGNFAQVCHLLGYMDRSFSNWLSKSSSKYTGHDMQNEMLQVMALRILREITSNLQSTKYCIMIDKTSDINTQEQVVVVMRWVDGNLDVHEDFIGLLDNCNSFNRC